MISLVPAVVCAGDIAGSSDHPLVGRYEGSEIVTYSQSDFDQVKLLKAPVPENFSAKTLPGNVSISVGGKSFVIAYRPPSDRSALEVAENYSWSLAGKGFETMFECVDAACLSGNTSLYHLGTVLQAVPFNVGDLDSKRLAYRLAVLKRDIGDIYVSVTIGSGARGPSVTLRIVETKPIENDKIVFLDASAMEASIDATGRVALYGIFFDTDKTVLKPESAPTLAEIAKLLSASPKLDLIVTGHTDNQGAFDYNVDLSQRRAKAVIAALAGTYHSDKNRLTPFGAGMAAPVSLNADEAGRARNRRVELVKR